MYIQLLLLQIIYEVIHILVSTFEPAILSQQSFPLINAIVGVHLSYGLMEKEMFWFVELSKVFPKLPSLLKGRKLLSSNQLVSMLIYPISVRLWKSTDSSF